MSIESAFALLQQGYTADPYPDLHSRRKTLRSLRKNLVKRQDDFARAVSLDFGGRHRIEVLFSEIYVSVQALRNAEANLAAWMERRPVELDLTLQFASAFILPQPLGVVGVISPWNYPIFLAIGPLAGALAAGNRVFLKPSEFTPATSALLAELIAETFPPNYVSVVQGGIEIADAFSRLPFDHLLFTGSTAVGKKVMAAAAPNLTPITLELGGKSPALLAPDASLKRAADDIAYGKFLNAGQTCIAPDYVLVPRPLRDTFLAALTAAVQRRFPSAVDNPQYTSIINEHQFTRLAASLQGLNVVPLTSGTLNPASQRMPPCAVLDPPPHSPLMRDEIFGPILPIITYDSLTEAIHFINSRPRPLALYLFSHTEATINRVLEHTIAGGVCLNDTLMQIVADGLPFGGIGPSGIGHYHGKAGFDTFSKLKPVFRRHGIGIGVMLRPPYGKLHEWMAKLLIR